MFQEELRVRFGPQKEIYKFGVVPELEISKEIVF